MISSSTPRGSRQPVTQAGIVLSAAGLLVSTAVIAVEPETIDDLGLNAVTDRDLFHDSYRIENTTALGSGSAFSRVQTTLELDAVDDKTYSDPYRIQSLDNLDSLTSSYQSQGLRINRLSTAWNTNGGTLTVGNDWTNFQDFLGNDNGYPSMFGQPNTTDQVSWTSRSGLSIALEESELDEWALSPEFATGDRVSEASPNLILSWEGGPGGNVGKYRLSALGRKLDLDGSLDGQGIDGDEIGWGLNLAGGWRFGDLFAALSVTVGNGIDSLLFRRPGNDLALTGTGDTRAVQSFGIQPSLNYAISPQSSFHVALGRYETEGEGSLDTLDTIHLGYTWTPWPSTNIGLQVVGKDAEGATATQDSAEVTFGAEKRF